MSGIYIKGMTMPKNCHECVFGKYEVCGVSVAITGKDAKRGYCPLVPVTDVVERKDVIEAMMKASTPAFDKNGKPTFLVDYVKVMEEL